MLTTGWRFMPRATNVIRLIFNYDALLSITLDNLAAASPTAQIANRTGPPSSISVRYKARSLVPRELAFGISSSRSCGEERLHGQWPIKASNRPRVASQPLKVLRDLHSICGRDWTASNVTSDATTAERPILL